MKTCSIDGCDRKHYSGGLCEAHYRRHRRTGSTAAALGIGERVAKPCDVDACGRMATERGLCHAHYLRLVRNGTVEPEVPFRQRWTGECPVPGCEEPLYTRGLCRIHYRRLLRTGDVQADVPIRGRSRRGRVHHGYRYVPVPSELLYLTGGERWVAQHRLVMAKSVGRPLRSDESVHHRNGDRLDNRMENLELWSRWQPSGQRVADRIANAVDLLLHYAPHLLVKRTRWRRFACQGQLSLEFVRTPEQI